MHTESLLFKKIFLQIIPNLQVSLGSIIYRDVIEHTLPVVGCVRTKKFEKVGAEYMNICAQLYLLHNQILELLFLFYSHGRAYYYA